MSTTNQILAASLGLSGSEVITAGETATAGTGRTIAFLLPLSDDATITTVTGGPTGLPNPQVLTKDVAYPFHCSSVTLGGASAGDLFVAYL